MRKYYQWNDREWQLVHTHFKSWIENRSQTGTKGPLPGKVAIMEFLKQNSVLESMSDKEKITVIKTKIFNERTKYRNTISFDFV